MLQVPSLSCSNIVYGIHDVKMHSYKKSLRMNLAWKINKFLTKHFYKNPCVFSKNQQQLFEETYHRKVRNLGMSYKNFGSSDLQPQEISQGIKLLFFGSINVYKGLDLLIEAMESLYDEGITNMSLTIAGKGDFWDDCRIRIKHAQLYNLKIKFIDNTEVADLFCSHHFLVLPYRDATQSGPLLTSLFYSMPIIAPKFGCFLDTYNSDCAILYSPGTLKEALRKVALISESYYDKMVDNCLKLRDIYSEERIANNYVSYFNELIKD